MSATVLDAIPFRLDEQALMRRLLIDPLDDDARVFGDCAAHAVCIGRPRAMHRLAYIQEKGPDYIVVEGVRFTSRVLRVNVEPVQRVAAYVATCGMELQQWGDSLEDDLHRYWADAIKQSALAAAVGTVMPAIEAAHHFGQSSTMNPGSLTDWPISQQRELFTLLGDVRGAVGVTLTDTFLMLPTKTVSGLRYPSESTYENCQLCPRDNCPGRRAAYDPELYQRRYAATS